MLIFPTPKMKPILGMTGMGGGATGYLRGPSGAPPLFNFNVGTQVTLRPSKWGSYGMSLSDWTTIYSALGVPWNGVSEAIQSVVHPQELSRGNPVPGVLMGITGFPTGIYQFTLDGASGADADPGFGAPGGRGIARISITTSDVLWYAIGQGGVYTGGASRGSQPSWYFPNPGGWNGGGDAGAQNSDSMYSGSGGGSTDIRLNGTGLSDRILIAGGGGGATDQNYMTGGAGGTFNGNGQPGGYDPSTNNGGYARGGTQSAGGSGALYNGTLYEPYMSGDLWEGGFGYDGSQPVNSANAAGGGGGGYYGGGGAVDEGGANASGSGGGSGYAYPGATNISGTLGGAANGNPSWSWSNSSVNGNGRPAHINEYGNSVDNTPRNSSPDGDYNTYRSNGTLINDRFGGNGKMVLQRIS